MEKKEVKIGLVQMSMTPSVADNLLKAVEMIHAAARKGAQIVCLPELFSTRYFAQYDIALENREMSPHEIVPGKITKLLSIAAEDNNVILIGGSIYEKAANGMFNTSPVFDERGSMIGTYRKTHIPHDEYFFEKSYFDSGDTGFQVYGTSRGRIGVMICYDQWFPEAARINALMGADMLFYPTAIGIPDGIDQAEGDWHEAWENVMRGHAIANGLVVAACNRVGREDKMNFWGGSCVIDAFGRTLARGSDKEEVVVATVDLEHGKDIKEGWKFFHNRRPECYSKLSDKSI